MEQNASYNDEERVVWINKRGIPAHRSASRRVAPLSNDRIPLCRTRRHPDKMEDQRTVLNRGTRHEEGVCEAGVCGG